MPRIEQRERRHGHAHTLRRANTVAERKGRVGQPGERAQATVVAARRQPVLDAQVPGEKCRVGSAWVGAGR